tara:strand:+ start:1984 stop:3129 length:1146 start_codon:yes stop_codon:yes gene_type:complete
MKKKIIVFSGSRADYGILKPLLKSLNKEKKLYIKFLVGSHHNNKKFGFTKKEIINDKIKIDQILSIMQKDSSLRSLIKFASKSLSNFFYYLNKEKPDLLIVLGDRYEVFLLAFCAYLSGINICHLHGGEVTNGSFDEGFRHSISKFSNLHFVVHNKYKKRLINLGENPKFIFNFGSLSVAQIIEKKDYLDKKKLFNKYKIPINKKVILVTVHSETLGNKNFLKKINQLYSALDSLKNHFYIFTLNNQDPLGDQMYFRIHLFKKKNFKNTIIIDSMGNELYYNFLKNVDLVLGNSSSGIIEAPALKTPTLNIGNRQNGRIFSSSIFHSEFKKKDIIRKINKIFSSKVKYKNEFYTKKSTQKMIKKIKNFLRLKNYKKEFYDK